MAGPTTTPEESTVRERSGWRWVWRIGFGLLLLLGLLVAGYLWRRERLRERVREAVARMDREHPGWRLEELEAARAELPPHQNGALCVLSVVPHLPKTPAPEDARLAESLADLPANQQLTEEQTQQLETKLAPLAAALAAARQLADRDTGRYPIRYSRDAISTPLPHLQQAREVAALLQQDTLLRLQREDLHGAMVSCRACINAGRSIGDEPTAISQLVRIACVQIGCDAVKRVLGQGEPPADDLESLQRLLEKEDAFPGFATMMRGERAFIHRVLEAMETGVLPPEPTKLFDGKQDGIELPDFLARDRVWQEHPDLFPLMKRQLEIARLPTHERPGPQQKLEAEVQSLGGRFLPSLIPTLGNLERAYRRHHAKVRTTVIALAAERYRQQHGEWPAAPKDLGGMVPASALTDPCDGNPLRYKRLADGVLIYSVGTDGSDDGGTLGDNPALPGTDLGVRLWDVEQRRLPPAAPE